MEDWTKETLLKQWEALSQKSTVPEQSIDIDLETAPQTVPSAEALQKIWEERRKTVPEEFHVTVEVEAGTGFSQGIFVEYGITVDDEADEVRNGGFGSTTRA